eukprot:jgi/Botrbrau1/21377/Bobra.0503s0001.1
MNWGFTSTTQILICSQKQKFLQEYKASEEEEPRGPSLLARQAWLDAYNQHVEMSPKPIEEPNHDQDSMVPQVARSVPNTRNKKDRHLNGEKIRIIYVNE